MQTNSNNLLIDKIKDLLPPHIKLPEFLVNTLGISRQSAYRKINGEMTFSFEQVSLLSRELGFSMDEIAGLQNEDLSLFGLSKNIPPTPQVTFENMLERYYEILVKRYKNKNSGVIVAMNRLPFLLAIPYKNLFRFFYYKWTHRISDVSLDYNFSEVVLPQKIIDLCSRIEKYLPLVDNNTYIIDPNVFYNSLVEIQYYYRRKLIDEEGLSAIKDDLSAMIDMTEKVIRKGKHPEITTRFDYYLSKLPIENNSFYIWYNDTRESYFWIYPADYVSSKDPYACSIHQNWLESLKKFCALASQSNEELQSEYFRKHRQCLDEML